MIKWFEDNPVALVLASIGGGLLLISLILAVVWSLPPSATFEGQDSSAAELTLDVPELAESEPLDAYAVITERPVFNESRLPMIEDDSAGDDEGEDLAEEVDAPDLELAGVIITPSIRMATLKSKESDQSLVAFEGQPLEGDYGTWQVSLIEPRQVTLSSGGGEQKQLQLQVHDAMIAEPPRMAAAGNDESSEAQAGQNEGENDQPLSRAEEIRQRIAERREELRRAAESKEEGGQEQKSRDYKSTIQSMISAGAQKKEPDENER
ncbi:hypothetical protein ACFL1C_07630 [Pseudomonadota bacterium]